MRSSNSTLRKHGHRYLCWSLDSMPCQRSWTVHPGSSDRRIDKRGEGAGHDEFRRRSRDCRVASSKFGYWPKLCSEMSSPGQQHRIANQGRASRLAGVSGRAIRASDLQAQPLADDRGPRACTGQTQHQPEERSTASSVDKVQFGTVAAALFSEGRIFAMIGFSWSGSTSALGRLGSAHLRRGLCAEPPVSDQRSLAPCGEQLEWPVWRRGGLANPALCMEGVARQTGNDIQ